MSKKRQYKHYNPEFKEEAISLVTEQGYSVSEAAASLGIRTNQLYGWKKKHEEAKAEHLLSPDEKTELLKLRKEVKKGQRLLCERNEVKFQFIRGLPFKRQTRLACRVMQVSHTAYYDWLKRPAQVITADELHLYRRMKQLFAASRSSLGSRGLVKKLRAR